MLMRAAPPPRRRAARRARGATLIEALVAMLVFVVGVVGMLRMQAVAAERERDAMYRAEASALAQELVGVMWTDRPNLAGYAHRPTGEPCNPAGATAANPNALLWLDAVTHASSARRLPGAVPERQQVIVDTSVQPPLVRVHVCWKSPQDAEWRHHVIVSRISS